MYKTKGVELNPSVEINKVQATLSRFLLNITLKHSLSLSDPFFHSPLTPDHDTSLSYPNFVWGPLFIGMRPSFDHLKMFNTHRGGIHKVLRYFREKLAKNTKMEVYFAKWGVCK